MERIKINIKAREHVREILRNYNKTKDDIEKIRESILYPYRETDSNVGGGRSNVMTDNSSTIIKLVSHEQLRFKSKSINIIDSVLSEASEQAELIITNRYFVEEPLNWVKISQLEGVNYSIDNCKKIERAIVDEIGVKIGF